ncbi:MAG: tetratricopeptide repeat protein [candidate division Zixibacteria bacterium]|nr:tetratricopeptide repeat protein [candidate division Zixibacteria bacterium]MCI0595702.1 tetratricopeptide repeat protein [candidate division Zixibacteria bacterium]
MMDGLRGKTVFFAFLGLFVFSGCVYFNTFYLAKKSYSKAEKAQKKSGRETADGAATADYQAAIKWASKVLTFHPKSGWADDALFLIGRSYYNMGEHFKAQGKFEELLAGFPDSKFAPEAKVYLARSVLKSGRPEAARDLANRSIDEVKSKDIKGELALVSAESYFALGDFSAAAAAYEKVLTYPIKKESKAYLYSRLGAAFFQQGKYVEAYGAYSKVPENSPSAELSYNSALAASDCAYQIGRAGEAIALINKLSKDPRQHGNLGDLKLKIAQGYVVLDSIPQAMEILDWMTDFFKGQRVAAQSYLEMGKIFQEKLGDLRKAKENYEQVSKESPTPSILQEALARSQEITRFESFQRELALVPDSSSDTVKPDSAKQYASLSDSTKPVPRAAVLDSARLANSWYLLAEVYRLSLKKPDSALWAYRTVFEKFPQTPTAPKALLAHGFLQQSSFDDSIAARSMYRRLLSEHPHSDYAKEALSRLGLLGTPADTGYPEAVFREAEKLWESGQLDSARLILASIPERFPESEYAPKALLSWAMLNEAYRSSGNDSAAVLAYQEVLKKYPDTPYAQKAKERVGLAPPEILRPDTAAAPPILNPAPGDTVRRADTTEAPFSPEDSLKWGFRQHPLAPPVKKDGGFVYPASEIDANIRTKLVFRVLLDFEGKVRRAELQNPTRRDAIDQEARRAVEQTEFDMVRVPPGQYNTFFIYELRIAPRVSDPNAPTPFR